ncbi:hypothetical protein D9M72_421960 [compost metagenome]
MPVPCASSDGRSCVVGSVSATASTVLTRTTPNRPRSVMYADSPRNTNTTSDFRLPAPMRTSVLLPHPDASTMPKPNISPPASADSQPSLLAV